MKEKIKIWFGNNWFKAISALVLLMIGLSIFYYFFLRPHRNDMPYRECIKQIDLNANFNAVEDDYLYCIENFK
ncbi:MAG: hypothetical protein PHC43_10260 [Candidatus Marinimicrobia bacterium]|nr:hypothetical protein [Candidatus Neomarinimicrobiota bacterium]